MGLARRAFAVRSTARRKADPETDEKELLALAIGLMERVGDVSAQWHLDLASVSTTTWHMYKSSAPNEEQFVPLLWPRGPEVSQKVRPASHNYTVYRYSTTCLLLCQVADRLVKRTFSSSGLGG